MSKNRRALAMLTLLAAAVPTTRAPTQATQPHWSTWFGGSSYDEATIFGILDAGLIAHLGYTLDGHPFVTPTVYWREGRRLYRACLVDGLLDEGRARQVAERVAKSGRRGSLAILSHFHRLVALDRVRHTAVVESAAPLPPDLRASVEAGLQRAYGKGFTTSFQEDPALIGCGVEELLRWDPPLQLFERWVLEHGVEVAGVPVARGEVVSMLFGAANRDPRVFVDADRLDVARANAAEHIGFGGGITSASARRSPGSSSRPRSGRSSSGRPASSS